MIRVPACRLTLRLSLAATLLLAAASPSLAQKPSQDPRPRAPRAHTSLPGFRPGASLAAPSASQSLMRWAVPAAPGAIVTGRGTPAAVDAAAGKANGSAPFDLPRMQKAPNGTARWMAGALGRVAPAPGKQAAVAAEEVAALLDRQASVLGLERPSRELAWVGSQQDALGATHVRFEQTYQGVPVWARDLYVHLDADGEVYAVNGTYEPTPTGAHVEPSVGADVAIATVVAELQAEGRWAPPRGPLAHAAVPSARLVLFPADDGDVRLAYEVDVHANLVESYLYLTDAQTGAVLTRIARHCSFYANGAAPPVLPALADAEGSLAGEVSARAGSFRAGNGRGVNGRSFPLRVWESDDGRQYMVWDLPNIQPQTLPNQFTGGSLVAQVNVPDEDGSLFHVTTDDGTWPDAAAVNAHAHAEQTFRYYAETFGRKAIDDLNTTLISVVHFNEAGAPVDNAYWNGRQMVYGDGDRLFKPLSAGLDVSGHEMTHGVIQHTANLIYQFESGALNESFADVFGAMIDRDDYLLGEDIMLDSRRYSAMRDLANPSNRDVLSPQPAHMDDYQELSIDQDNGGVHVNSGILNRAAFLVADAIGRAKTEQIYYRALSTYLTRNSQFIDARNALEQSARDLHGAGSVEEAAVQAAFDAVGIAGGPTNPPDDSDDVDPVEGGTGLIAFLQVDGQIGVYDVEANQFNLFPNARARVNLETGDLAQLSTPLGGESIWYVDPDGRLAYVLVGTGEVFHFPDLSLYEGGDLWNASIAPDGSLVTLVSSYRDDASVYVSDGEEVFRLPLQPDGTQQGTKVETIQYPDVVAWSPNARQPKLAVDALNVLPLDADTTAYWSVYELDVATGKAFNLVPAQPTDLSIGNITYSNTDPGVLAFNLRTEANQHTDVILADFDRGEAAPLGLVGSTVGGTSITLAMRPTFAPADDRLAIGLPELNALAFYDLDGGALLDAVTFPEAIYNPRWFVFDGAEPEPEALPAPGGLTATTGSQGVTLAWGTPGDAAPGAAGKAGGIVAGTAPPKGSLSAWAPPQPASKSGARVDEVEPNNTLEASQVLRGASPLVVNGNAEVSDEGAWRYTHTNNAQDDLEDLYQVTTTAPGLSVGLGDYAADLDLYLLRVDGESLSLVAASFSENATEQVQVDTLSAGTYYVAVSIYDPAPGQSTSPYTLTLTGAFEGGGQAPPSRLQEYFVYRATQPDVPLTKPNRIGSAAPGAPTFLDDTVPTAGTYYYAVTAVYASGESGASNVVPIDVTPPPCPVAWRSPLSVTNAAGDAVALAFGQGGTATAGVDEVCEEVELLPPPPLLIFDARFQLTGGSNGTPTDLRSPAPGDVWRLRVQSGGPARIPVTLRWDPASLPDGDVRLRNADGLNLDMKAQDSFTITERTILSTYLFQIVYGSGSATSTEDGALPTEPVLSANYPNPFNTATTIEYAIPQTGPVRVEVFDAVGRRVAVLVDGVPAAGRHALRFDARGLPSGTYFYRLQAGPVTRTQQMVLLK